MATAASRFNLNDNEFITTDHDRSGAWWGVAKVEDEAKAKAITDAGVQPITQERYDFFFAVKQLKQDSSTGYRQAKIPICAVRPVDPAPGQPTVEVSAPPLTVDQATKPAKVPRRTKSIIA